MKLILILVIISGIFSLGYIRGQTSFLKNQIKNNNECLQEILDSDETINSFYNHRSEIQTTWTHAEAMVALKLQKCMWRK